MFLRPVETALEFRGLSTDKKPEVTTNGSAYHEITRAEYDAIMAEQEKAAMPQM